jgi:hypothetical protein
MRAGSEKKEPASFVFIKNKANSDKNLPDLCSFGKIYARSGRFMLVREDLCSFGGIYAPWKIMLETRDLRPQTKIKASFTLIISP